MKMQRGITLLELMVAVTIVGILMAVAIPTYSNYVMRGRIPEATTALSAMRVRMEQYFQDNRTYAGFNCVAAGNFFNLTCTAQTAISYTIQAAGTNAMAGFTYTINEANTRTSTIAAPAPANWRGASATCWITKQGAVC